MINMIAAIGSNNEIGKANEIPWNIKEDLKYFKEVTLEKPILMGRKTYESIGRPLPKRINVVLTSDINFSAKGVIVVHSKEEAMCFLNQYSESFIIGGSQIYDLFLEDVNLLYLTLVDKKIIDADAYFPEYRSLFKIKSNQTMNHSIEEDCFYQFTIWEKK